MPESSRALFQHLAPTFALHLTGRKKGGSIYCTTLAPIQDFKWAPAWQMGDGATWSKTLRIWLLLSKNVLCMPFATSCDLVHEPIRNAHTLKTWSSTFFLYSPPPLDKLRFVSLFCSLFGLLFLSFRIHRFPFSNHDFRFIFRSKARLFPIFTTKTPQVPPRLLAHSSCTKLLRKPHQWPIRQESRFNEYYTKIKEVSIIYALKGLLSSTDLICFKSVFSSVTIPKYSYQRISVPLILHSGKTPIAPLMRLSEKSWSLWMLYSQGTLGPLPALPLFRPGLFSSVVNCGSSPATEIGQGLGVMYLTLKRRKGGRTSTANVVGNRLPNLADPSSGGPEYLPSWIGLKSRFIRLDNVIFMVRLGFGLPER